MFRMLASLTLALALSLNWLIELTTFSVTDVIQSCMLFSNKYKLVIINYESPVKISLNTKGLMKMNYIEYFVSVIKSQESIMASVIAMVGNGFLAGCLATKL